MRSFKHLTPRFLKNRILEFLYLKSNPHLPWLTKAANQILDTFLLKSDVGIEFGSGRSTIWLANKIEYLISIEHNEDWYQKINLELNKRQCKNVEYHLKPKGKRSNNKSTLQYLEILEKIGNESLNFALIDGKYRDLCALKVIDKIKPGGFIIIDNVNRYLPSDSISPSSRSIDEGPLNSKWYEFDGIVENWRKIWTSSGVTDTAFFFKPV